MALSGGARLGPYEILFPLGVGGMGEVYRARDTKLNRDVALKVLLPEVAGDLDRLARFRREAQVLASLNHPHIGAIHGLEESDGTIALVMELVEGEDLAERIARGAIPLDEALPIARQIADALEAAHEQGIVHRDLKPANIKVRPDGTVKVLDFGLAKALDPAPVSSAAAMHAPTITTPAMTEAGMILGTAAYMSPEQAKGKPVDRRADVWAFGCVLFEMLSGRRAFAGDDVTEVLASVLAREPEWVLLPAALPPGLGTYVRRCLQKDPRQRVQSIGDVRLALAGAFETAVPEVRSGTAPPGRRRMWMAAVAVGAVLLVALAVPALQHWSERPAPESPVTRFTWALPDGVTPTSAPRVSPDGRRVVIAGGGALFVRPLDALEAQRVPDTDGAQAPFWSPDSKSVGFFAGGKLKRVDLAGGPVVTICEAIGDVGASWSRTGVIVFAPNINSGLQQVSAAGGMPEPATVLDPAVQAASHRWPQFLPDGEHFLYLSLGAPASTGIFVASLGSPAGSLLLPTTARAEYAHPGALLFQRGTTLMHQPFDAGGLRLTGDPVPLAEGIGLPASNDAGFSVSMTGVLTYATGPATLSRRLVWVDRRGAVTPLPLAPGTYSSPALSPDGRQIVLILRDATGAHLWVYDIARGTLSKRTFEGGDDSFPIWTADGAFLTFTKGPLVRLRADGSGAAEPLVTETQLAGLKIATSWSFDGRFLAIQNGSDVVVRDRDGVFHPALATSAYEREGRFAPDGGWLAYRSDESGRDEVYVQSYPPGLGKWQISTDGGAQAMWAANGRELFYKNGNRMMAVDVELGTAFKAGTPRVLFDMPQPEFTPGDPSRYGVTPDGRRFLVLTTATTDAAAPVQLVTVVLNWAQTLTRLAPAAN